MNRFTKWLGAVGLALGLAAPALGAVLPYIPSGPYAYPTASASFTTSQSTISLASPCPIGIVPGTNVLDFTLSTTGTLIGTYSSCVGYTLTLSGNAAVASSGAGDLLRLSVNGSQFYEPNQIPATLNTMIQQQNLLLPGEIAGLTAPFNPAATSAQTFLSTNVTLNVGQAVRARFWGTNGGSASTNTITLNYGSGPSTTAIAVTGTSANWWVDCEVTNVGTVASPKVDMQCHGVQGTTAIATAVTQDTSDNALALQQLFVTSTATVASQQTVLGAYFEYVR